MALTEIVGNPHVHTPYSDGTMLHAQVAQAAARAGLDFVIVTDHNIWVDGVEGYYEGVLLLVGEEVHDTQRLPQCNHLLIYGAEDELATEAFDPQTLIDEVNIREGLSFLAHPVERSSPLGPDLAAIPWVDWEIDGYTGIELWNYMSEFKSLTQTRLSALFYAFNPGLGIKGPFPYALRLWDKLLNEGRRVVAIGGGDAHANVYSLGPISREVLPYEHIFGCVNTHLLVEHPLTGDLVADKEMIYSAMRAGHGYIGYDVPGSTRGFRFQARSGSKFALMGDELKRQAAVIIDVEVPVPADTRLLCNGKVVARSSGRGLQLTTAVPGVYRVEVYRRYRSRKRAWILAEETVMHWDGELWTLETIERTNDGHLAVTPSHVWIINYEGAIFHKTR